MGPNGVFSTTICFTFACVNDIYKVCKAIVVAVVTSKIYIKIRVGNATRFYYHIAWLKVVSITTVASIIRHALGQIHRAYHIKLRNILSVRLIRKVLTYRTCSPLIVVLCTIHQIVHTCQGIARLIEHILEVCQNHKTAWRKRLFRCLQLARFHFSHCFLPCLSASRHFLCTCHLPLTLCVALYLITFTINPVVMKLITY